MYLKKKNYINLTFEMQKKMLLNAVFLIVWE